MKIVLLLCSVAICSCFLVPRLKREELSNLEKCRAPTHMPGRSCNAKIKRYTFNKSTTDCEEFFYGGCNPSPNNFETMEQCRATCVIH
ncbi:Kunitz/Bovine pancreatic trypsin inhibitor domain protein [Ancylostoma ceylanicum]|uniref:Kunitz/Bovine pancreatic trypsin inhibitor domain protein n=1 Tax=Ancylostoma ceylanicum TaxID=53326 RepID=A0A0D6L587_9BILA|nr:Kunitz/Bovine pancreatic trypsin inhibitor domain protein [Ancylostoma ceylanicum]